MTVGARATIESLFTHMEWADAETWTAVLASKEMIGDERLRTLLYHIHVVQRVYLQMWQDQRMDVPPQETLADASAVHRWAHPYYGDLRGYLARVDDDALGRTLDIPWTAEIVKRYGSAGEVTLFETMMQVVLHSMYHRAQAATRIRELGGDPPLTDFVAWAWRNRPQPRWVDEGRA